MWMPERVWEQSMTSDLVAAGIQYTMLDDFHFKNAGLSEDQLHGYYLTEDDGQSAGRVSRQRAAALHDSLRLAAGDDRLSGAASPSSGPARSSCSATTAKSSAPGPRPRSTSTTTAGWRGSSICWSANESWIQVDHAGRGDRQRAAASARSICPRAAIAK